MSAPPPEARILCVGNRLVAGDDAGCRVHDLLASQPLPDGVELVDGGLHGLNLLGLFEGCRRVVVCDAASGFGAPGTVHVVPPDAILPPQAGGHAGGIAELLAVLPLVVEGPMPRVTLVAVERPADAAAITAAAAICRSEAVADMG